MSSSVTCSDDSRVFWRRVPPDGFPDLRVPPYVEKPVRSRSGVFRGLRENRQNLLNVRADFGDFGEISKIPGKRALFLEIPALPLQITECFWQSPGPVRKRKMNTPHPSPVLLFARRPA